MRPAIAVLIAFAAALVGGSVVYVLGELREEDSSPGEVVSVVEAGDDDESATPTRLPPGRFDPSRIYAARSTGVVTLYSLFTPGAAESNAAQGSGFVVSPDGYILTSAHVIAAAAGDGAFVGARRVYVGFQDGERVPATVVGWDLYDDVGVVRVDPDAHELAPLPLGNSDAVRVGEPVAAIGSPFEQQGSLAVGVVSATRRSIPSLTSTYHVVDAIQTDAPITHGNSGGPLLDSRGRVIGINAQIRTESGQTEGVGFAIPIDAARRSLRQLIETGRVRYPYVGISTDDLTPSLARHLGLSVERGALIASMCSDSPAARAGLRGGTEQDEFNGVRFRRGGDVVVAIDGRPVDRSDDVARLLVERHEPGDTVRFGIVRDGERRSVPVRLGTRPATARDSC